jgi:hypothetical protein
MNAPVHIDPSGPAYTTPLEKFDVSDPGLYQSDSWYPYFERLRREDPIHFVSDSPYAMTTSARSPARSWHRPIWRTWKG